MRKQLHSGELRQFKLNLRPLSVFADTQPNAFDQTVPTIPIAFTDYLELVDFSGRAIRTDKSGAIEFNSPSILERLGLDSNHWLEGSTAFEANYSNKKDVLLANS